MFFEFNNDFLIKSLYTTGDIFGERYPDLERRETIQSLDDKPMGIIGSMKGSIRSLPYVSNIIRYRVLLRKFISKISLSNNLPDNKKDLENIHDPEVSLYPKNPLISWFPIYLQSISRRIECNPDPLKEGSLLRIILQKNV